MCGIFGAVFAPTCKPGARRAIIDILANAMSYRGTHSWGVAFRAGGDTRFARGLGDIANVEIGALTYQADAIIGHTRYATTGEVSIANAHPFRFRTRRGVRYVAHNGMVYNWTEHRKKGDAVDSVVLARRLAHSRPISDLDGYGALVMLDERSGDVSYVRLDSGDLARADVWDDSGALIASLVCSDLGFPGRSSDVLAAVEAAIPGATADVPNHLPWSGEPLQDRVCRMSLGTDHVIKDDYALDPTAGYSRWYSHSRDLDLTRGGHRGGPASRGWTGDFRGQAMFVPAENHTEIDPMDVLSTATDFEVVDGAIEITTGSFNGRPTTWRVQPGSRLIVSPFGTLVGDFTDKEIEFGDAILAIVEDMDTLNDLADVLYERDLTCNTEVK